MKISLTLLVGAWTLSLSTLTQAAAGWTDDAAIAELSPTAHHHYEFRLQVKDNPSGCKNKSWFYQDYRSTGANKMFQTLLEGVTSGKRLRVYVTGKCNLDGHAEISAVSIIP